jgi:hypothetical protein
VRTTVAGPAALAGVTQVTCVGLTGVNDVHGFPPTVTPVAVLNIKPLIVIVVPPPIGPTEGEMLVIDGALSYRNAFVKFAVPVAFVAVIVASPAGRAGVRHVTLVGETGVRSPQTTPPTVTAVTVRSCDPVSVMSVLPAVGPFDGLTRDNVGALS